VVATQIFLELSSPNLVEDDEAWFSDGLVATTSHCRLRPGPAMLAIYPKPLRSYVPLEEV